MAVESIQRENRFTAFELQSISPPPFAAAPAAAAAAARLRGGDHDLQRHPQLGPYNSFHLREQAGTAAHRSRQSVWRRGACLPAAECRAYVLRVPQEKGKIKRNACHLLVRWCSSCSLLVLCFQPFTFVVIHVQQARSLALLPSFPDT